MTDKPLKAGLVDRTEFSDEFTKNLPLTNGVVLLILMLWAILTDEADDAKTMFEVLTE